MCLAFFIEQSLKFIAPDRGHVPFPEGVYEMSANPLFVRFRRTSLPFSRVKVEVRPLHERPKQFRVRLSLDALDDFCDSIPRIALGHFAGKPEDLRNLLAILASPVSNPTVPLFSHTSRSVSHSVTLGFFWRLDATTLGLFKPALETLTPDQLAPSEADRRNRRAPPQFAGNRIRNV